jgi:hypothetical protein
MMPVTQKPAELKCCPNIEFFSLGALILRLNGIVVLCSGDEEI